MQGWMMTKESKEDEQEEIGRYKGDKEDDQGKEGR